MRDDFSPIDERGDAFRSTHWSLVVRARDDADSQAADALSALCDRYWHPLYAYVRRRIADVHDAQDLTQTFFARLLEKRTIDRAAPDRGRFRAFLLASLKNFLAGEWERARAQKRGGGVARLSLDFATGESRLVAEPAHDLTPERLYERRWAFTLLEHATSRLEREMEAAGKARQWQLLKETLAGGEAASRDEAATELGMTADAVRQTAHRLRKRYREILREEVAQTVSGPDEVDAEIRALFAALAP